MKEWVRVKSGDEGATAPRSITRITPTRRAKLGRKTLEPTVAHLRKTCTPTRVAPGVAAALVLAVAMPALGAPSLRIAVGVERAQDLALAEPASDHTAMRALGQGVREACVDPSARRARGSASSCKTLGDVPESNVCVDVTTEQALTRQIECEPGDLAAQAVDLTRSGCETSGCFEVEARKAGATHLLVVTAAWIDAGLKVSGRFTDLSDSSVRPVAPIDFAPRYSADWPRTEPQVLGLLKWMARAQTAAALVAALDKERAGGSAEPPAVVASSVPAPPPETPPAPPSSASSPRSWLGWTLIGAGVAAGVASGILWHRNGELTDCDGGAPGDPASCRKKLHTLGPAIGLGVAALGGLVGGTIVLIRDHDNRAEVTLFLHPTSVALGGRF